MSETKWVYVADRSWGHIALSRVELIKETDKTYRVNPKVSEHLTPQGCYWGTKVLPKTNHTTTSERDAWEWLAQALEREEENLHNKLLKVTEEIAFVAEKLRRITT